MNRYQAIQQFLESFDIPAYVESSVPSEAEYPYLTYTLPENDNMGGEVSMNVNVWYYTDTETKPNQKVFEIAKAIGYGGKLITFDDGAVWLKKGSPWVQNIPSESNNKIKHRYLNVDLEYLVMN